VYYKSTFEVKGKCLWWKRKYCSNRIH